MNESPSVTALLIALSALGLLLAVASAALFVFVLFFPTPQDWEAWKRQYRGEK